MAENNQRDVDRLVADLSVSSTRSSRVRMVPAGGHFAQGDGAAAPAPTTVGGAAAGRRFRQRTAMDEEEPRPAGARFADSRPAGARFASAHVDEDHVDDGRPQVTRPAGRRFSSSSGAFGPVSSRVPAVPKHGAPEKPDAASVTTAAIDISDSHAATEPLSHGSEVLAAPKPADTAEFTAAATAAAATRSQAPAAEPSARALGGAATLASGATPLAPAYSKRSSFHAPAVKGARRQEKRGAKGAANNGVADRRASSKKKAPRGWRDVLPVVLIVVGVVLLLAAAFIFVRAQLGYREAQATYDQLETYVVTDTAGDDLPSVDFDELEAINPDVVGWIYVPGTPINYPVVQTTDNTTYLRKLFDGTPNGSGTVFMDCDDTAPGGIDQQTTLYGHHTQDGKMFRAIDYALDQDKFDQIDAVYYMTRDATYVCRPLMDCLVEDTFTDARIATFEDEGAFSSHLTTMRGMAKAVAEDVDERQASAENVLTLVTCSGEIIPRTTRAAMVCTIEKRIDRL